MGTLFGDRWAGRRERDRYQDAAAGANYLTNMSRPVTPGAPRESLGTTMRGRADWESLQGDTYDARAANAGWHLRDLESRAQGMANDALRYGVGTGDWGGYMDRLGEIGQFRNAQQDILGANAMRPFYRPTLANAARRNSFNSFMDAANAQGARDLREWAALGLRARNDDMDFALQDFKAQLDEGRLDRQYGLDLAKLGLDFDRYDLELRKQDAYDEYRNRMLGFQEDRADRADQYNRDRLDASATRDVLRYAAPYLRAGASDEAFNALLEGDASLLRREIEAGRVDPLALSGTGGRATAGTSRASGGTGRASSWKPDEQENFVRALARRRGYDTSLFWDKQGRRTEAGNVILEALPDFYERYGNKEDALDAAVYFSDPSSYISGQLRRLKMPSQLFFDRDGKPTEAVATLDSMMSEPAEGLTHREQFVLAMRKFMDAADRSADYAKNKVFLSESNRALAKLKKLAAAQATDPLGQGQQDGASMALPEIAPRSQTPPAQTPDPMADRALYDRYGNRAENAWRWQGIRGTRNGRPFEDRYIPTYYNAQGQRVNERGYPVRDDGTVIPRTGEAAWQRELAQPVVVQDQYPVMEDPSWEATIRRQVDNILRNQRAEDEWRRQRRIPGIDFLE